MKAIPADPKALLIRALRTARSKIPPPRKRPLDAADRAPGTGTNEGGPQVQTDYPANAWPEDGDHA